MLVKIEQRELERLRKIEAAARAFADSVWTFVETVKSAGAASDKAARTKEAL